MKVEIKKIKDFSLKSKLEHEYAENEKEHKKEHARMRACKWF